MVVWARRTFLRQKKLQSTEGRSVADVRTLNLLLRRLTRGPIRTHKTPETDLAKIIYPLGQDRSVKTPRADGLWKWTFVARGGDNSVYVHGNCKTLFSIFSSQRRAKSAKPRCARIRKTTKECQSREKSLPAQKPRCTLQQSCQPASRRGSLLLPVLARARAKRPRPRC